MNKRSLRITLLAAYLTSGAFITQLGNCAVAAGTLGLTTVAPSLIDANGRLIGIFNVCGVPNIQVVDQDGVPTGGILNGEDDLMFGCPVTFVVQNSGNGG